MSVTAFFTIIYFFSHLPRPQHSVQHFYMGKYSPCTMTDKFTSHSLISIEAGSVGNARHCFHSQTLRTSLRINNCGNFNIENLQKFRQNAPTYHFGTTRCYFRRFGPLERYASDLYKQIYIHVSTILKIRDYFSDWRHLSSGRSTQLAGKSVKYSDIIYFNRFVKTTTKIINVTPNQ